LPAPHRRISLLRLRHARKKALRARQNRSADSQRHVSITIKKSLAYGMELVNLPPRFGMEPV